MFLLDQCDDFFLFSFLLSLTLEERGRGRRRRRRRRRRTDAPHDTNHRDKMRWWEAYALDFNQRSATTTSSSSCSSSSCSSVGSLVTNVIWKNGTESALVNEAQIARTQKITMLFIGYASYALLVANFVRRPLHPKFHASAKTRRRMFAHILLGAVESSFGAAVLFTSCDERNDHKITFMGILCALSALAQFVTSVPQITSAFGTPKLVRPVLHFINCTRAKQAIQVLLKVVASARVLASEGYSHAVVKSAPKIDFIPTLIDQLVLAQGFAYSRVFVVALSKVDGVREHGYTFGTLLAAQLVVATTYGFFGSFCLTLLLLLYANIEKSDEKLGKERQYWGTPTKSQRLALDFEEVQPSLASQRKKRHTLRDAFDTMDLTKDHRLQKEEVEEQLLNTWGLGKEDVDEFFASLDIDGDFNLDYEEVVSKDAGRRTLAYVASCLDNEENRRFRHRKK